MKPEMADKCARCPHTRYMHSNIVDDDKHCIVPGCYCDCFIEAPTERKVLLMQHAKLAGVLVCGGCGFNMHIVHGLPVSTTSEDRAVCYTADCQHYQVTFTIHHPVVMLVQYEDTVSLT